MPRKPACDSIVEQYKVWVHSVPPRLPRPDAAAVKAMLRCIEKLESGYP